MTTWTESKMGELGCKSVARGHVRPRECVSRGMGAEAHKLCTARVSTEVCLKLRASFRQARWKGEGEPRPGSQGNHDGERHKLFLLVD